MTRYSWRCGYRRDREPFTWPLPCGDHEASRWWWLTAEEWRARMAAAVLGRADAGNGHLLEHVRGGDGAVGVAGSAGLELGRTERLAERAGGFPDGHVDVGRAAGGAAVELGGDKAGLLLHVCGVVGPHLQEPLGVFGCQVELVDEDDRAVVVLQLLPIGDLAVHLTQGHRPHC